MNEKLLALAMIRAGIADETDTLQHLMAQEADGEVLLWQMLSLTCAILDKGLGTERALAALDWWMEGVA